MSSFSYKYLVMLSLFFSLSMLAAQPALPDNMEIHLFEKPEKVFHPDNGLVYMEREMWRVVGREGLVSWQANQVQGLPDYSYFSDFENPIVHPETGDQLFFGRHKLFNRGARTLFILKADGTLVVPFPHAGNDKLSRRSHYAAAHEAYLATTRVAEKRRLPLLRHERFERNVSTKTILGKGADIAVWVPGSRFVMAVGLNRLFLLDLEKKEIHETVLDNYLAGSAWGAKILNFSGGATYGEHFFLYNETGVYRVEWNGSLTHLFKADQREPGPDLFDHGTIRPGSIRAKSDFQAFRDGAYFIIGNQVHDREGNVVFRFSPKHSEVAFSPTQALAAVTHRPTKTLKVVDLLNGTSRTVPLKNRRVLDVAFAGDGSGVCVQYLDLSRHDFHFEAFSLDAEGLTMVAAGFSEEMPAMVDNHLFFLSKKQLYVQKIGDEARALASLPGEVTYWLVKRGNEVMYTRVDPFETKAYRNRAKWFPRVGISVQR